MLGILGGSGVYELEGLTNTRWELVQSPFGAPSDAILLGELGGQPLAFLPRHGRGHRFSPSKVNYRANIHALKRVGCTQVLSLSAVGSLREDLSPGTFVIVNQYVDRTFARQSTFFDENIVAHVSMAQPVCLRLSNLLEETLAEQGGLYHRGGTYLAMEGPQFSTLAESRLHKAWGCDVVGMTNMPEAKLAREAELCYASLAMVTDYDCWHPGHDDVSVELIIKTLAENAARAKALLVGLAPRLVHSQGACPQGCSTALSGAIITQRNAWAAADQARLDPILRRVRAAK